MTNIIVFDTETTGLIANRLRVLEKQPWITELYAEKINLETGEQLAEFQSWFKPGVRLEKEAAKVTGLTDEFLSDKPLFSSKVDEIEAFFGDCNFYCGQNITFDLTIMEFEFRRCGKEFHWRDKKLVDTVEQSEWRFGYRPKLGDLYEHIFGERFTNAHSAISDVHATTKIVLELYKRGEL